MKKVAVVVAGGSGSRMQSDIPKQFLLLGGKPLLIHTLTVFRRFAPEIELILALPAREIEHWQMLCNKFGFGEAHTIVEGGKTRFHSVKNALYEVENQSIVGVHDGVRPLVSTETLRRCYQTAEEHGNALPVADIFESVRKTEGDTSVSVNRDQYKIVQTPQVFRAELIKQAYEQAFRESFTDDASVAEAYGVKIRIVKGNRENIKITTPHDLYIAEALLSKAVL